MRTTAAVRCALAAAAVLLTTTACGGTHHAHAAAGGRAATVQPAATAPTGTPKAAPTPDAAARALIAMVNRVDAQGSARIVLTQEHTGGTVIMTGLQSWGRGSPGLDLTVPPAKVGMEKLSHADRMEVRCVAGAEYLRIDPAASGPLKGKRWLRYTGSTALGSAGADTTDRTGERSPVDFLRAAAVSGGVTRVGRESMSGEPTTHYRGTFTTAPALQKRGVPATAEFDVYVGDDGLPVLLVDDYSDEFTTTDFRSFGGAHPIAPPPAAQTATLTAAPADGNAQETA